MSQIVKDRSLGLDDLIKQDKEKHKQQREVHRNRFANKPFKRYRPNDAYQRRKFHKKGENDEEKNDDKTNSLQKSGKQGGENIQSTGKDQSIDLSKHLPKRKNESSYKNHQNRNKEYNKYNHYEDTRKNHSKIREQRRTKGGDDSNHGQRAKKSKDTDKDQSMQSKPVMLKFFGLPLDFSMTDILKMFGNRQYFNIGSRMKEQEEKNGKTRRYLEVMVSFKHKQEADSFVQIYSAKLFDNRYLTFQMRPLKH